MEKKHPPVDLSTKSWWHRHYSCETSVWDKTKQEPFDDLKISGQLYLIYLLLQMREKCLCTEAACIMKCSIESYLSPWISTLSARRTLRGLAILYAEPRNDTLEASCPTKWIRSLPGLTIGGRDFEYHSMKAIAELDVKPSIMLHFQFVLQKHLFYILKKYTFQLELKRLD